MTDKITIDRAVVEKALVALTKSSPDASPLEDDYQEKGWAFHHKAITTLRAALDQPMKQPDGLPMVIAGALFDFAGFLTTREKLIVVGSTADAAPIADLVKEWAGLRELSLDDAAVRSWQEWINPQQQPAVPQPVIEALSFYANGEHFRHLTNLPCKPGFGWDKERASLTADGFVFSGESDNGTEFYVEGGRKAEQALAILNAAPEAPAVQRESKAETALNKVLNVIQRYLPPDGPTINDAMSEIIGIVDPWPLDTQPEAPAAQKEQP